MKLKQLLLSVGLTLTVGSSALLLTVSGSKATKVTYAEASEAQPGEAPIGVETDWKAVTGVAGINTSDFYMLRTTINDSYQYSTGELAFVNGVALYTDSFANARMFKFVEGTNGYKVNGLFDLADAELENCHYLDIDEGSLWVTDTEEDAAEFDGYDNGGKITLQEHGQTSLLSAVSITSGDHAGKTMILNFSSEDYAFYSGKGWTLPLELVRYKVPAEPVYSYIDLRGSYEANPDNNWETAGAKFAVCYQNKTDDTVNNQAWSELATAHSTKEHIYVLEVPELDFVPNNAFLVRLSNEATEGSWDYKWNQANISCNLGAEVFTVGGDFNSASSYGSVAIKGGVTPWTETTIDTPLTHIGLNYDGKWEFSGDVVIAEDSEIKVFVYGTAYDGKFTNNSPLTGIVSGDQFNNIRISAAGTYKMYYNISTYSVHITTETIQEANTYAEYFLENVGCDATGETAPTGWTTVKAEFEGSSYLSNEAKKLLVEFDNPSNSGDAIQRCTFLYDLAIKQHSELVKFMKYTNELDAEVIRQSSVTNSYFYQSSSLITITIITTVFVIAVGALVILKKKKEN